MKKNYLIGIFLAAFLIGFVLTMESASAETTEVTGLEVTPATGPYNPDQQVTVKLTKTDGVYAVYRKIFYKPSVCPATGECWKELPDTLNNGFAGKTELYTVISPTHKQVVGQVNIPSDAVGTIKLGVATFKLVNGVWSTDQTLFVKSIVVTGSDYCPKNDVVRCNGDKREKCVNHVWQTTETCTMGCKTATANNVVTAWCKQCTTVGEKSCKDTKIMTCNSNFKLVAATDCGTKSCVLDSANKPVCGVCVNGNKKCKDDSVLQTCVNGAWSESSCQFLCSNNACINAPG